MKTTKFDLSKLRSQIDKVDNALLKNLSKRLKIVEKVALYKKPLGIKPIDKKRWQEVLRSRKAIAKSLGVSPKLVEKIYEEIHLEALKIESKIMKYD